MTSVLDGIRVLDLSWGVAGPIAGMLLADHGAAVKDRAARARSVPRHGRAHGCGPVASAAQCSTSRNPTTGSIPRARQRADVVLESFRPGHDAARHRRAALSPATAPRLLLDHRLRPRQPPVATGPLRRARRRAPRSARATQLARRADRPHERRRAACPTSRSRRDGSGVAALGTDLHLHAVASMGTAFLATMGINAALLARESTGRGQHVETSMLQGAMVMTAGKWQRVENQRHRLPHVDHRPTRAEGVLPLLRRSLDRAVGTEPEVRALERRRRHARVAARISNVRDDPDRVSTTPRT